MWVNQGAVPTVKTALQRIRRKFQTSATSSGTSEQPQDACAADVHPFDLQHGVDTSGLIWGEHLTTGKRNDEWNTAYYGIAPSVFHAAIDSLPIEHTRFTLCDIGSGKGRGVLLATRYPFRNVYGIEIVPELHAIALQNLGNYTGEMSPQTRVELLNKDATEFIFPIEPLVLFFYHPFCRPVLQQVLQNLGRSLKEHPREVFVVYINPELRGVLDRTSFLEKVSEVTLAMAREDYLADRVGSSVEECAIYCSRDVV